MKKIAMFVATVLLLAGCACGSNHNEVNTDTQVNSVEVVSDTTFVENIGR